MKWTPLSEMALRDFINSAYGRMSVEHRRFWEAVRVEPEKWALHPMGDEGGGFWVVAVMGRGVVWYNDIEDGFNVSPYSSYGVIGEYRCNQDELELAVMALFACTVKGPSKG